MENRRKSALVTGASVGIGRELAKVFAQEDFDLVIVARRERELSELADEIQDEFDVEVLVLPKDLSRPEAPLEIFDAAIAEGMDVDVLVNNAGMATSQFLAETPYDDIMRQVQLNTVCLTAMTRLFVEPMLDRGYGRIMNVGSIVSFFPTPSFCTYGATKAYVLSFSEALSEELKGTGVTVTTLCPGYTDTDMIRHAMEEAGTEMFQEFVPAMFKMTPATVARDGYRACMQGKPLHITGLSNQLTAQWLKYQPRWLIRSTGGFLARLRQ